MNKLSQVLFTILMFFIELSALLLMLTMLYFTLQRKAHNVYFDIPVNPATLMLSFTMFLIVTSIVTVGMYAATHPKEL